MNVHHPLVAIGPLQVEVWTLAGRVPVVLALVALAVVVGRRSGWRRGALALSGACAGLAIGAEVVPSVLGAVAGMLLLGWLTLRSSRASEPGALPVAAALLGVVGVGRLGCLLNGCCFGMPTRWPWGVTYAPGSIAAHFHELVGLVEPGGASLPVHPVQAYEGLAALALLAALPWLSRRLRSGTAAALLAAAGYLVVRAALDPLRAMVNMAWSVVPAGPLAAFQWAALAGAAACAALAWLAMRGPARERALTAPEPGASRLWLLWAAQGVLAWLGLPALSRFLAVLVVGSLALSAALLCQALLAGAEGRTPLRRLAGVMAALALVPLGLRAGDPGSEPELRFWIYAPSLPVERGGTASRGAGGETDLSTAPPSVPSAQAGPAVEPSPETSRLVRVGDQDTPAAVVEERAGALAPRTVRRISAHALVGGPAYRVERTGCNGEVVAIDEYERRTLGGGLDYEEENRWTDEAGREHARTWQVRGDFSELEWTDRTEIPGGQAMELGSGGGQRWTAGGMYQWEGPRGAVGLGGVIGRDATGDTLPLYFTRDQLVLYPGLYLRVGTHPAGLEAGSMSLDRVREAPFLGVYLGPAEAVRVRVGWVFPYQALEPSAFFGGLQIDRGPISAHLDATTPGHGVEMTLRLGYALP